MIDANLIPAIVISFAVTTTFMFALRPVAKSVGLVDRPGGRKSHIGDVPIIGGIAMYLGMIFGLHVLTRIGEAASTLSVAAGLLVAVGVLDDKYAIPPSVRFAAQIAAALIMVYGGSLILGEIGDPFGTGRRGFAGYRRRLNGRRSQRERSVRRCPLDDTELGERGYHRLGVDFGGTNLDE